MNRRVSWVVSLLLAALALLTLAPPGLSSTAGSVGTAAAGARTTGAATETRYRYDAPAAPTTTTPTRAMLRPLQDSRRRARRGRPRP